MHRVDKRALKCAYNETLLLSIILYVMAAKMPNVKKIIFKEEYYKCVLSFIYKFDA